MLMADDISVSVRTYRFSVNEEVQYEELESGWNLVFSQSVDEDVGWHGVKGRGIIYDEATGMQAVQCMWSKTPMS